MNRVLRAWRSLRRARQIALVILLGLVALQSVLLVLVGLAYLIPLVAILFVMAAVQIKQSAVIKDMAAKLTSGNNEMSRTHRSMQQRLVELERIQQDSRRALGLLREHVGRTGAQFDWIADRVIATDAQFDGLARAAELHTAGLKSLDGLIHDLEPDIAQSIASSHEAVSHSISAVDGRLTAVDERVAAVNALVEGHIVKVLDTVDKRLLGAFDGGNSHSLERKIVSEISALMLLRGMAERPSLPAFAGWSMSPLAVHYIQTVIGGLRADASVVELGSGVSTAWTAFALAGRDDAPKFIAVDHDPSFAAETADHLTQLGRRDEVELVVAPLETVTIDGVSRRWYATEWIEDVQQIGLLIVDGPPAGKDPEARYPALPLLLDKLADEAIILVDDADRPGEADMIATWLGLPGIRRAGFVGRSMILTFSRGKGENS